MPEITIPQSVTTIGNNVFLGCEGLNKVIIADRKEVLKLGSNGSRPLFSSCPLDSVYVGGNIIYPTSKDKGYSPFYSNTSLRAVHITGKDTEISDNEFYGCTNLKNVHIEKGVKGIGSWAFSGCSSLDFIEFGAGMKTIGQEAFSDCTNLTKIISRSATPPTCGSQALDDINKWTCTLVVPADNVEAYQTADQWSNFFFIEPGEGEIEDIEGDANGDGQLNEKDLVAIVSYIMGNPPADFKEEFADLNNDGVINAADVVILVGILKGK